MTKVISIFVYDKEVYKIAIKQWRIARRSHTDPGRNSLEL